MSILLSFTEFNDPFSKGLVEQEEQPGSILSVLKAKTFQIVYLFDTLATSEASSKTKEAIKNLYPQCIVPVLDIKLSDPTNYHDIFKELKEFALTIQEEHKHAKFYISVASGTPKMHACWVLLAASGEVPAKILHVRPPRFVTKDRPLLSEIELSFDEFPSVRFKSSSFMIDEHEMDVDSVRARLGIVGDHPTMLKALEMGAMLASSLAPILIIGETGTGKELFARYVHALSGRPQETFVAVKCAAIPEDLVESILFGHKKGAFTGAVNDQTGKFDAADKGTLFLDELGELPLPAQAKLLRVLQDGIVEPIGHSKGHAVDVRIVAATNRELRKQIRQGSFREDLYYRLNVGEIKLPSLLERRSDIPKLVLNILDRLNTSLKRHRRLTTDALSRLQAPNWEGNI